MLPKMSGFTSPSDQRGSRASTFSRCGQVPSVPRAAKRDPGRPTARPTITKDGVSVPRKSRCRTRSRTGRSEVEGSRLQDLGLAGDGRRRHRSRAIDREGRDEVRRRGMTRWTEAQGSKAVIAWSRAAKMPRTAPPARSIARSARVATRTTDRQVISDAPMEKVGKEGVITVAERQEPSDRARSVDGMQFDGGISRRIYQNADKRRCRSWTIPTLLLYDKTVIKRRDLLRSLSRWQRRAAAVVIATSRKRSPCSPSWQQSARHLEDVRGEGAGFGDRRKAMLEEIAVLTGGQVIAEDVGLTLEKATAQGFGPGEARRNRHEESDSHRWSGYPRRLSTPPRSSRRAEHPPPRSREQHTTD